LSSLAGSLTAFSTKIFPRDLPVYDHRNLAICFRDLDEKLRFLLETVIPSNFVSLPLKLTRSSIYAAAINDDRFLKNRKMYLAMNAEMPEGDLILKTPALIKACSATHLEPDSPGAAGFAAPPRPSSTQFDSHQTRLAIFLDQPIRPGLGSRAARAELRSLRAGRFSNPQLELIVILPEGEKA
jgi:type VI secretion system protein ImpJ